MTPSRSTPRTLFLALFLLEVAAGAYPQTSRPASAAAPEHPARKVIGADDPAFAYGGRIDAGNPAAPVFIWQASHASIDFDGPVLELRFGNLQGQVFLDAQVDGDRRVLSVPPGAVATVAWPVNLGAGRHHLALIKRSEASAGTAAFEGIEVGVDAGVSRPAEMTTGPRILFLGDSITAGACNEDGATDQWADRRTHNADLSYAALTAAALGSDYRNISVSGIGISIGYGASTIPEIWDRLYPAKDSPRADLTSWQPDIVFFNFGENDGSFTQNRGQPFPSTFADRYVSLVAAVRLAFPKAELVLLRGGMGEGATYPPLIAAWNDVVKRIEATDRHTGHYAFTHWTAQHPRVADDRAMADELLLWLGSQPFLPPPPPARGA